MPPIPSLGRGPPGFEPGFRGGVATPCALPNRLGPCRATESSQLLRNAVKALNHNNLWYLSTIQTTRCGLGVGTSVRLAVPCAGHRTTFWHQLLDRDWRRPTR